MDPIVNDLINALIVGLVPVAIGALGYLAKQQPWRASTRR
jgi:hypothetical protein